MIALTRGPRSVGKLAEELEVSPPAATQLVDTLAEHGMVGRHNDPADRRVVLVDYVEGMHEVAWRIVEDRRRPLHAIASEAKRPCLRKGQVLPELGPRGRRLMERIVVGSEEQVVVILATSLPLGGGAYATTRLNQELLPDISFPIITISTPLAGAGPDLVDEQVTQPVEDAINGVEGIESVQSTSAQGFSVVLVEFDLDADTEEAEADLQAALDGIELPSQAGEPEVKSQSASQFPILSLSLAAGDQDLADLTSYAEDEVVPSIEEVEAWRASIHVGAGETNTGGSRPQGLKERDLTTDAVVARSRGAGGCALR